MIYKDVMYGQFTLPDFCERICQTPEFERMRKISQDSLPHWLIPWKVPSRMDHCLGVLCLAYPVITQNNLGNRSAKLLQIGALLHDVGNAALSHLSEPFLKQITGMDGESFLAERLAGTKTQALLEQEGFTLKEVVDFVTGNVKPLSVVLHGSMDIDNLDNVGRYWFYASGGEKLYNAVEIAGSFRFRDRKWVLLESCRKESEEWQKAREAVYAIIYGAPHLSMVMMVHRALDLALEKGELAPGFFHLSDGEAIDFLLGCNENSAKLVQKVIGQQRHTEVFCMQTFAPAPRLREFASDFCWRARLSNDICSTFSLPAWAVCVHVSKGKDRRRVELPFVSQCGAESFDQGDHGPLYRIKVYVDREFESKLPQIQNFVRTMVG